MNETTTPSPRGSAGRAWVDPLPRAFDARPYAKAADETLAPREINRHAGLLRFAHRVRTECLGVLA